MNNTLEKKAVKAGLWYTIGNILLKGCIFLTLPIFTKILSTTDFGIYSSYIALEGIISAVIGMGLYGTIKNAKIDFKEKFNDYLSTIICFSLFVLFIFIILSNSLYFLYGDFIGYSRFIINVLILQSYGSFLIHLYGSKLNIEFKYKSYLGVTFFNTIGNIILSIILILYVFPYQRYLGRIVGSALPIIIVSVIIVLYILKNGKDYWNKKYIKYAILIGLPLVPHVVSQSLLSQFDRIMIEKMIGASEGGIYSYIYTICTILFIIVQSLDNAWNPWVYIRLSENNTSIIKKSFTKYIDFFSILTLGFLCLSPEIVVLFAGSEYWSGIDLIIPLTVSNYFVFLYMLPVGIEYYHKKTKFISLGTVCATIANLVLNFIFIKLFGFKAAAYTTLISYILLFVFHWIMASKYELSELYDIKHIIKTSSLIFAFSIIIYLIGIRSMLGIGIRYVVCLVLIIILLINVKDYLKLIKRG